MSDPLIDPADLAVILNDPNINVDRAVAVIADAQTLCESVVAPLVDADALVVKRVAARAYVAVTSSRQQQIAAAGGQFGGGSPQTNPGGVMLTRFDKADLRRNHAGGGAFSINMLPSTYSTVLPWWDAEGYPSNAPSG